MKARGLLRLPMTAILMVAIASSAASAEVVLKLGDILVIEPGPSRVSVIDPATGNKTTVSEGGLLLPHDTTIGVALALDGDIIAVHRRTGLIRIDPATGAQSILSTGGFFRDAWGIAVDKDTGYIYVADSGFDVGQQINEAGKVIRVDPASGAQELIAVGSPCTVFPADLACQNTTSAGSYLAHPYGIAIDYTLQPGTIVVADMGSFNGQGAIIRIQPFPNGSQTLLWGPSSAVPPPLVNQALPMGCPMGVAVEPNGNILTTVFTFPVPPSPSFPPPAGTFYGCSPPGIYRVDLVNRVQSVLNTNGPSWQSNHSYALGDVIFETATSHVHRVTTSGISQSSTPTWNSAISGFTLDGSVVWQNIGRGANWLIPFGLDAEPAPTPSDPSRYNVIVGDEGFSAVFRLDSNGALVSPVPFVVNISNVTSVDVITFTPTGGFGAAPVRSNGLPSGTLQAGTTQTTMSLTTNVDATCRYSTTAGVAYSAMTGTFATTGGTGHSTPVTGLVNGGSYSFFVRCQDTANNTNTDDFLIAFSVASSSGAVISNFVGSETPLSEGGMWDSPGAWADLRKNNGAFAAGPDAQARLVTPAISANQYSEITYDQNPGSSSWVGVTTRTQGAQNGSGYLAIVFAGEVQLYRTDDTGALNFTPLASAPAAIGTAPRRLRLESSGNLHRVYFNGTELISHTATGTVYSTGQPGIAASVFGGPQVKILSFEGGGLATDTTAPVLSNGQPSGTLGAGTTSVTLRLNTDEAAVCRYSTTAGVQYNAMTGTFTTTGGTSHSTVVTGLVNGGNYSFFVRCQDSAGNSNPSDFPISFAVAGNGLVAAYGFDEASGTTTLDASGNNRTGTLTNVTRTTAGKYGRALSFNGVDSWVTVADANALDLTTGMTLEAWVNPTASGGGSWRNVIIKERPSGEVYNLYSNVDTNVPTVYVANTSGAVLDARGTSAVPLNTWTHLAATYDGTTLRLFVGGTQVGTRTVTGPLVTSTGVLRIGGNSLWGEFFEGQIDEVRIYNRALSASEIQSDMNVSVGGTPTVNINQAASQADPTSVSPINFTVVFGLPVADFATGDVTLGGTAGATTAAVTGGPTTYNVAVSGMTSSGTIIATVGAGVAHDASGNANLASISTDNTVTYDTTALTVTINQAAGQGDPTAGSPINFTVVFSEPVADFATGDVSFSGTAAATTAVVSGGPTTYNVAVSGMSTTGTVIATVPAAVAHDAANNGNSASTSTDNAVTYNTAALTVTINQATGQGDPTTASPINFTVVFSAPVTDFATGDVTLGGTAGATTATVTGSGTTYNVAVSGMTTDGTVVATVAAGAAHNAGGTGNAASTSTDNTVTFNTSTLTVTINQASGQVDPTSGSSINYTVVFSAPVADFATGDVTLGGTAGATTATVTGSGTTYTVAVSGMTTTGTVVATVGAGVATDAAGNGNAASTSTDNTVTYNIVIAPAGLVAAYGFSEANGGTTADTSGNNLTGTISGATRTTQGKFGNALTFDGVNDWVTVADSNLLDVTTAMTLEVWVFPTASGGGSWRTVLMKERSGGEVYNVYSNVDTNVPTAYLATTSGAVLDARGTTAVPLDTWTHLATTYDGTTLRLFVGGDLAGTRAVEGPLVTSTGALRIGGNNVWGEFFAGRIDEVRIYNRALSETEIELDMNTPVSGPPTDTTPPTVAINQASGQADPTTVSPINFTVVFSEPVTGFATADVSLGGTAGATTAVVTGGPTTYTVAVSGMSASGTVVATIAAGVATDAAGNGNGASTSTDNTVTYNVPPLSVTINQAAGQADPTSASPINFTVVFSAVVTDFATGDVTLGGTAGATTATVTGSGTTYNVAVSGMTTTGTVITTLAAGVAHNAGGTGNAASTSTDNIVTYDGTAPTVTINQASGQADPTTVSPINFTVVFSEAVTGFATGDVTLNGTAGATTATVTGGPTTYNVAVSGMTTSGTVIATVGAGVASDTAGNGNGASTSADNTVTYNLPPLNVTINQAAGQADPTSGSPINFTVLFSAAVTDFATGDVTLGGTAGATTATVTGSGTTYNVAVSGMTTTGTVIATVAAGVAHSAGGTGNAASTSTDNAVTYDGTAPTVTINQAAGQGDPTSLPQMNFTVVFSEAVTGFATGDVTLSGTAGATTAMVTGGPTTYNVAVSGMTTSGTVIATVGAGVASDAAGNGNGASTSADNTVTYDAPPSFMASPSSATVVTGTLNSGTAAALVSDDDVYYAVNSTTTGTRTAAWYGSFAVVPRSLISLLVNYKGNNSRSCTQTVAIWNWTTSAWAQLDSRTVGTTEIAINNLTPTGTLANYVSGTGATGEVRIRIQCQANGGSGWINRGDLMNIVYTAAL